MAMLDETTDLYGKAGKQYEKNILCFIIIIAVISPYDLLAS